MLNKAVAMLAAGLLIVSVVGCGSKEEKRAKFFDKGRALYAKGDFVRARLEFKNALQIDPVFAEAYFMLGNMDMKEKAFKQAFSNFSRAGYSWPANHFKRV